MDVLILLLSIANIVFLLSTIVFFKRSNLYIFDLKEKEELLQKEKEKALKLETENKMLRTTKEEMEKIFKGAAQEALTLQSESFLKLAQERLDKKTVEADSTFTQKVMEVQKILDPVKVTLSRLQEDLSKNEKERSEQFGKITQSLAQVMLSSEGLKNETSSLTKALKRPEVRGSWGEIQLKRVVELAGMSPYCDFEEQVVVRDSENVLLRPDLIVKLPNQRTIVVDSKAVFDAFIDAIEAKTSEEKNVHLERHAKNLRVRVNELSKKSYWEQFENSPEFAILFVPNEALLAAATEIDRKIIEDALSQKIVIATPTTLVALLKAIHFGWQQNEQTENTKAMVEQVEEFYDRASKWLDYFSKLGKNIESSVKTFNDAASSLDSRLLPSMRRIRELGFKNKEVPDKPLSVELSTREVRKELE